MKRLSVFIILIIICITSYAQRQRSKSGKKVIIKTEIELSPEDKLYASMLPSTAKIMFIDSVVVDKDSFLTKIPLNNESGKVITYQRFFNKSSHSTETTSVYINEFGDQAYYVDGDTIGKNKLLRIDWIGEKWSEALPIDGIDSSYQYINYPYVMSDGVTLFFSAKGSKSIGGYDIFTTTFDSETGKFYEPQNFGLPFNSKSNDYFFAIDEFDNIGWLVSDRNQPDGKVCIYTFSPSTTRKNYESDNLSEEQLNSYANIQNIAETWKFGDRNEALQRRDNLLKRLNNESKEDNFNFVINDNNIYHRLGDFKNKTNRQKYLMLNGQKAMYRKKAEELAKLRDYYFTLPQEQKARIANDITSKEQENYQLYDTIRKTEKAIRNCENKLINN